MHVTKKDGSRIKIIPNQIRISFQEEQRTVAPFDANHIKFVQEMQTTTHCAKPGLDIVMLMEWQNSMKLLINAALLVAAGGQEERQDSDGTVSMDMELIQHMDVHIPIGDVVIWKTHIVVI